MSQIRRVGSFKNPITGEMDWLEPADIGKLGPIISPTAVTKMGNNFKTLIEYELSDCQETEKIGLVARYENEDQVFKSEKIEIPELEFATILADAVYAGDLLDDNKTIQDMKEKSRNSLTKVLLDNNIILCNLKLKGLGFIKIADEKLLTLDEFSIELQEDGGVLANLSQCVGSTSLGNLKEDITIEFYSDKYAIVCDVTKVLEDSETLIKNFKVGINSLTLNKNIGTQIDYTKFENFNQNDDEQVELFLNDRMSLLDLQNENDSDMDLDMFDF